MTYRKKLIEVALPLNAINRESEREKTIRHGHPSTLHLWWARRPLAACRAVIFASLVDDPGESKAPMEYLEALDNLDRPPTGADGRRERLFYFIERLVKWESTTDEKILDQARKLIRLSCEGEPPPVLDPFCGGGSIPLEAQRLGLETYASDLNPVAVLITKALIEIPPKFAGKPPVNPDDRIKLQEGAAWKGAAGLAADVRYYGKWMRDRAWERTGHLYPKGLNGETVIAWLWARTVKCPNPACGAQMPLVRSFWLSTKKGNETWVEPIVDAPAKTVEFDVRHGKGTPPQATKHKRDIYCIVCQQSVTEKALREQASTSGFGTVPLATVIKGQRGRVYLKTRAAEVPAVDAPDVPHLAADLPENPRWFSPPAYGLPTYSDLFTPRQLVALTTFSDLVGDARELALQHAREAGLPDDGIGIADGGSGATAYSDSLATYLALAVNKAVQRNNTICTWEAPMDRLRTAFTRQAIPMAWDYAETNPFAGAGGDILGTVASLCEVLERSVPSSASLGTVKQLDATSAEYAPGALVVTDPPYYDNIGYSDLSDFFYVWLRRSLSNVYADLFSTLLTPKGPELIADPYRHGGKQAAERHFEDGFRRAFGTIRLAGATGLPVSLFYAFRQAEKVGSSEGPRAIASTGWQTMLSSLISEGYHVVGTWPMRTEATRGLKEAVNALASSIVLTCRGRSANAPTATFKQFQSELSREMPPALSVMTGRDRVDRSEPWVDPIDLRQAAIGPGMAVYSRYSRVQKADGSALSVREALQEINEAIDAYFDEVEGELDRDSRFCAQWYRENGFKDGTYGRAEVLAQAMDVGVEALGARGLLLAKGGRVRLLRPAEYSAEMPQGPSIWELCHRLVGALEDGEEAAARLYNAMPGLAEEARDLAYRLYLEAEKKNRAEDALGYNALVASWTDIRKEATTLREESQAALL